MSAPMIRPGLARTSSAASGLRFCGMIEEPVVNLSDSRMKPNCAVDQSTISSASRDRWTAQIAPPPASRARNRGPTPRRANCATAGRNPAPWPSPAGRSETTCRPAPPHRADIHSCRRRHRQTASGRAPAFPHRPGDDGRTSPAGPPARWVKPGMTAAAWPSAFLGQRHLQLPQRLRRARSIASRT